MPIYTPGKLVLARNYPADNDSRAYIAAVETADGQSLESGVKMAIDAFVIGCKADGIWNAIKASCILAGARTLTGALVPLVGTAPTNVSFVSGDYNRKTGLVGDGSTKYLNSNRSNSADPQNSNHNAFFASTVGTALAIHGGDITANTAGTNQVGALSRKSRGTTAISGATLLVGFAGINRSLSNEFTFRNSNANAVISQTSVVPDSLNVTLFASLTSTVTASNFGTHRLAFYSIGESLDLALLDTRVTTLINAFAAAIP
jgi:hypothetical protein